MSALESRSKGNLQAEQAHLAGLAVTCSAPKWRRSRPFAPVTRPRMRIFPQLTQVLHLAYLNDGHSKILAVLQRLHEGGAADTVPAEAEQGGGALLRSARRVHTRNG